jgi:hypothetical protein
MLQEGQLLKTKSLPESMDTLIVIADFDGLIELIFPVLLIVTGHFPFQPSLLSELVVISIFVPPLIIFLYINPLDDPLNAITGGQPILQLSDKLEATKVSLSLLFDLTKTEHLAPIANTKPWQPS